MATNSGTDADGAFESLPETGIAPVEAAAMPDHSHFQKVPNPHHYGFGDACLRRSCKRSIHHCQCRAATHARHAVSDAGRDGMGADLLHYCVRHHDSAFGLACQRVRPPQGFPDLDCPFHRRFRALRHRRDTASDRAVPLPAGCGRRRFGAAVAGRPVRHQSAEIFRARAMAIWGMVRNSTDHGAGLGRVAHREPTAGDGFSTSICRSAFLPSSAFC